MQMQLTSQKKLAVLVLFDTSNVDKDIIIVHLPLKTFTFVFLMPQAFKSKYF